MTERAEIKRVFNVDGRTVTVTAVDQVGPEDCMTLLIKAVMHRHLTGEDVVPAISRDVKDALIKQNLVV